MSAPLTPKPLYVSNYGYSNNTITIITTINTEVS